jgi:hypothetical protein
VPGRLNVIPVATGNQGFPGGRGGQLDTCLRRYDIRGICFSLSLSLNLNPNPNLNLDHLNLNTWPPTLVDPPPSGI